MWRERIKRVPAVKHALRLRHRLSDWWFDRRHHVQTAGYVSLKGLVLTGAGRSGFDYLPNFLGLARRTLEEIAELPHAEYTFVDLGSGKGRMVLMASRYPFRRIVGVEFALELHQKAMENLRSYRSAGQSCRAIELLHMDAADYAFADEKLVVYLFNPFGREVMSSVLKRLDASIRNHPRDVIVIMALPQFADVADACESLRLWREGRDYRIYRSRI